MCCCVLLLWQLLCQLNILVTLHSRLLSSGNIERAIRFHLLISLNNNKIQLLLHVNHGPLNNNNRLNI